MTVSAYNNSQTLNQHTACCWKKNFGSNFYIYIFNKTSSLNWIRDCYDLIIRVL